MKLHNKLVRDKIPKILSDKNIQCSIRTLDEQEFEVELQRKLSEELGELESEIARTEPVRDDVISEIADCIEVIRAIQLTSPESSSITAPAYALIEKVSRIHQIKWSEIVSRKEEKKAERGAFSEKTFLISTEE